MLRVLTYHRIADPNIALGDPLLISARPKDFESQMEHVASKYVVISVAELLDALTAGKCLPERAVLVTFDDAYSDFADCAWPILQRLGIPTTLFVPTAYPGSDGSGFWWDRLYTAFIHSTRPHVYVGQLGTIYLANQRERLLGLRRVKRYVKTISHDAAMQLVDRLCAALAPSPIARPGLLNWDRLRALCCQGVAICAHTRTHPLLTRVTSLQARDEVRGAQQDIARELGRCLPVFAYPSGAHNAMTAGILQNEKIVIAFTTLDGHNDLRSAHPLRLRRTNITMRTSLPVFRLRLRRFGSYIDMFRHGTWRHTLISSSHYAS